MNADSEQFEVVLISYDKKASSFAKSHDDFPWLAIPFEEKKKRNSMENRYEFDCFPTLTIINAEGKVICQDAELDGGKATFDKWAQSK